MRALRDQIDKFCRNHPRFGIPNLMMYIAIANVAIYLLDTFSANTFSPLLAFDRASIFSGQVWRLVTFVFISESGDFLVRGSGLFFVLLSAYFYYWIGSLLEREWGTAEFNVFYLMGVVLNILFGLVTGFSSMHYVNLSLFFAFAVLYPDLQVLIFFILPVKVKWLAWLDAALFLWDMVTFLRYGLWLYALLPVVAIFNFLLFFWGDFMDALGYRKQRFRHQHSPQVIQYKKAAKTAYEKRGYLHKCAVCGRTDADDPGLEFRYCSKCTAGTYCYCPDHLRNHTHIV